MRNIGRFIKGTAAAAVCALTLTGCENYSKMMKEEPQEYITMASENTVEAVSKSSFSKEMLIAEEAAKNGTFGFLIGYDDMKMAGDIYINEKDVKTSQNYTIEMDGGKAEIYAAVADNILKFGTIGTEGEHIYDIDLNTAEADLKNSVFAPGSGSSLELDQETYDMLVESFAEAAAAMNGKSEEDMPESYKQLEDAINKIMEENAPAVEEKVDTTIAEEEVKANIITYKYDKADAKAIIDAAFDAMMAEMASELEEGQSPEDIKAELDTMFESITALDIEAIYYVNSKSHCLMETDIKLNISVTEEDVTETVAIGIVSVYGADPEKSAKQTLDITIDYNGENIALSFISNKKDENTSEVSISAKAMGVSMEVAVLTFSRTEDTYKIEANIPIATATATIEGAVKTESDSTELTIDSVTYSAEGVNGSLDLTARVYAKKGGEYVDKASAGNILKMTEDELDTAAEALMNDFSSLVGESLLGSSMTSYVDSSKLISANANAKIIYTAFSAVLTQMAVEGVEFYDYDFYNENDGDYNLTIEGFDADFNEVPYKTELAEYLGDDFPGYYYVAVDSENYLVEYALWSDTPIDYPYQYTEEDQEYLAEEGAVIGVYPISE